jgi:dinuclear metal center YbgI/SA1388 family protein
MSVNLSDVVSHCQERLRVAAFRDYPGALNGLQVANSGKVTRIGAAVDAGVVPFALAADRGVDFLIVHHGLFWDAPRAWVGPAYDRLVSLVRADMALYASHLPLDAHPELGNNALMAAQLGAATSRGFMEREGEALGRICPWQGSRGDLRGRLEGLYPRVTALEFGRDRPGEVALCSGAGNAALAELARAGVDTLVTGELREDAFNTAQEAGINVYLCGHYATEVHGVKALAADVAARFGLPWEFIATGNPL